LSPSSLLQVRYVLNGLNGRTRMPMMRALNFAWRRLRERPQCAFMHEPASREWRQVL